MPSLPSTLGLTTIVDGSQIVASDHRNNYSNVQTAVNALIAALSGGSAGQVLGATSGTAVAWQAASAITTYRKTSAKAVTNSTSETDLLNGEITVGAGAMGSNGLLRLTAFGDVLQNSGGATNPPRFRLKLGGTVLLDTGTGPAGVMPNSATRQPWRLCAEIQNLASAASQQESMNFRLTVLGSVGTSIGTFATGTGVYENPSGANTICEAFGEAASSIDTSASKLLEFTVINPALGASMETKLYSALVEVI